MIRKCVICLYYICLIGYVHINSILILFAHVAFVLQRKRCALHYKEWMNELEFLGKNNNKK
jgi:hypothetical protein